MNKKKMCWVNMKQGEDAMKLSKNNGQKSFLFILSMTLMFFSSMVAIGAQTVDSRHDAGMNLPFNQKAGNVNPQTGNVTLGGIDVSLPGRAGFNFEFGRTWSLNKSNAFNMIYDQGTGLNRLNSETIEQHNHLGVGWNSNLPFIYSDTGSGSAVKFLSFGGAVYQLKSSTLHIYSDQSSNILGYDLNDKRVFTGVEGSAVSYADYTGTVNLAGLASTYGVDDLDSDLSEYVLILKDNSRYYFRPDGLLMMKQDRTGLNRIWYFYDEYESGKNRLAVVIDTLEREIDFSYDSDGNLSSVEWGIEIGKYDQITETRLRATETRRVDYGYLNAETEFSDVASIAQNVIDKETPYLLDTITNPQGLVTKYHYEAKRAQFSFTQAAIPATNIFLPVVVESQVYSESPEAYKNQRVFEYDEPAAGPFTKEFYSGFMAFIRITGQYSRNRHGEIMHNTDYIYFERGEGGYFNSYATVVQKGNVSSSYVYSLSDNHNQDHVLASVTVETEDGFLQQSNYSYNSERAKILDDVWRDGQWVYDEHYQYDNKGNLISHTDKVGLATGYTYDSVYSIPIETVQTVTVDGEQVQYRSESEINGLGQIENQYIYLLKNETNERVLVNHFEYDAYGNIILAMDALGNIAHTEYDSSYETFPVKTWQEVTIQSYVAGTLEDNWHNPPDSTSTINQEVFSLFNTDGTIWMELDSAGYAIEHYYDKLGNETQTVMPNGDDDISFIGLGYSDLWADYLESNFASYFTLRENNPGTRIEIDYQNDFVKTFADIDLSSGHVTVSAVQSNGLGNVEEEISYDDGIGSNIYGVKTMIYDDQGRMVALTDPDAGSEYTIIELHGVSIQRYDKTWIIRYDDLGRTYRVLYPETEVGTHHVKEIIYDDVENTITTTDPEDRTIVETKDWNGNLIRLLLQGDANTSDAEYQLYQYEYDELNRKIRFTDPMGIETKYVYDERSLLLQQDYGNGSDSMVYDDRGQLIQKTDRNDFVLTFEYDQLGRNTAVNHYESTADFDASTIHHTVSTVYDLRGNAVRIDNQNLIEHYIYDYANRVVDLERRITDVTLRSLLQNRLEWADEEATQELNYHYSYNDAGMVTSMTYPDSTVHQFTYDPYLGFLSTIQNGTEDFVSDFQYNLSGVVTEMAWANGVTQTWDFDNRKRIARISISTVAEELLNLEYTLNGTGDILRINDNEYGYDGFNRIISAKTLIPGNIDYISKIYDSFGTSSSVPQIITDGYYRRYDAQVDLNNDGRVNGFDHNEATFVQSDEAFDIEHFSYDKNGNRLSLDQNGDVYRYVYGERNKLLEVYVTKNEESERLFATYQYDNNGNTTQRTIYNDFGDPATTVFEYDTLNRLISSTLGSDTASYTYDNAGNRLTKVTPEETTLYLRHGQISVAMDITIPSDGSEILSTVNRNVLSGDLVAGLVRTTTYPDFSTTVLKQYYHLDHLNSTKMITSESASVDTLYEYRAFGEALESIEPEPVVASDEWLEMGFDDGSETTVTDSSGNGLDGTFTSGLTWDPIGIKDGALNFDGSANQVAITNIGTFDDSQDFTISFWIKPDSGSAGTSTILAASTAEPFSVQYDADTKIIMFDTVHASGTNSLSSGATLVDGEWQHVTLSYGNDEKHLYINGLEVASTNVTEGTLQGTGSSESLFIGSTGFVASMDELKLYKRLLAEEQIKVLFDSYIDDETKYTYGGKELDDNTNLYYFNARYYDATIGRFINVDPIQDGSNWYVYVNNNPLNMVDPTGLKGHWTDMITTVINTIVQPNSEAKSFASFFNASVQRGRFENEQKQETADLVFSLAGAAFSAISTADSFIGIAGEFGERASKLIGATSDFYTLGTTAFSNDIGSLFGPSGSTETQRHIDFWDEVGGIQKYLEELGYEYDIQYISSRTLVEGTFVAPGGGRGVRSDTTAVHLGMVFKINGSIAGVLVSQNAVYPESTDYESLIQEYNDDGALDMFERETTVMEP